MKGARALCAVTLLAVSAVAYGQPTAVEKLPEQVVVLAEVRNMVEMGQKIQRLAEQIVPGAMIPPPGPALSASVLKTGDPAVVDLEKPFQVMILEPPLHLGPVLVFSVADPQAYLASLLPNVKKVKDEGKLHVYSEAAFVFGGEPDEGEGVPLIMGIVGNRVALGRNLDSVRTVFTLMESGAWPEEPLLERGDAGAVVRLKGLLDGLDAIGQNPFDALLASMDFAGAGRGGAMPRFELMQAVLRAEVDAVQALAAQIDTVVAAASFGEDDLRVRKQVAPVPGSPLAQYLASVPRGELTLLKYMPADSMVVGACKVGDFGPLIEWVGPFMDKLMSAVTGEEAQTSGFVRFARQMSEATGDEVAFGMVRNAEGTVGHAYAARVKDVPAMEEFLASYPDSIKELAEEWKHFGMAMDVRASPGTLEYGGHRITEWQFEMEFLPMEGVPDGEQMAAMQAKMIEAMYGSEMKSYWTLLDGVWLHALGPGALDVLKAMIDGRARPVGESEKLSAALAGMPDKPGAVGYLELGSLAEWYMGIIAVAMQEMAVPFPLPEMHFEPGPAIGFTCSVSESGVLESHARIPAGSLRVIVDGFQSMAGGMTEDTF